MFFRSGTSTASQPSKVIDIATVKREKADAARPDYSITIYWDDGRALVDANVPGGVALAWIEQLL